MNPPMDRMSPTLLPERVLVASDAKDDEMTKRVLARLKDRAEVVYIESGQDPYSVANSPELDLLTRIERGKKTLLLTHYQGSWLKRCPGTKGHVCCNLWVVNQGEGCPFDCTYCCLQHYLQRNPTMKLYTNVGDLFVELEAKLRSEPDRLFRICTGELTDSLAWDPLTSFSADIVPFCGKFDNVLLELKTKSSFVDNLLQLDGGRGRKTIVSWSVNAREVIEADEARTASLAERIEAAVRAANAGYRIGLHFDPLVHFPGWEEGYRFAIKQIFSKIAPGAIAWISLSPLRYHPEQQLLMIQRFPKSRLPFGESFLASDKKMRLLQPLRLKMIKFVWNELKSISDELPLYLCMESPAAWRAVSGLLPGKCDLLSEVYSRRGKAGLTSNS